MVETRSGTITEPFPIMTNTNEGATGAPVVQPMTALPNVHAISPRHVVKMFDGSRPEELDAIIRECETYVKSRNPAFKTQADFLSTNFSNACLLEAVHRFDLKNNDVNTAYLIWKYSEQPTWSSLCQEMRKYFVSPFISAPQAAQALLSTHPTGADRQSLLNHISQLNEPYRAMTDFLRTDPYMADLFDFTKIHKLRNFLFLQSLLGCAPKEYHSAILEKVSVRDSPTDTCTKMAEAVTQVVGRKQSNTIASVWSQPEPYIDQFQDSQEPPLMTMAPVQTTRTTQGGTRGNPTRTTLSSWSRPATATQSSWTRPADNMTQNNYNARPNTYQRQQQNDKPENSFWLPQKGQCFNCAKQDHFQKDCPYTPFCWFHMREGHSWATCHSFPQQVSAAKKKAASFKTSNSGPALGFQRR